jgi:hypothetical protein
MQNQDCNANFKADFFQNSTLFPENSTISMPEYAIIISNGGFATKFGNFPGGVTW